MNALIDNDVLIKGACYRLLPELISTICPVNAAVGVLGSARFVVTKKIEKLNLKQDRGITLNFLSEFLNKATVLEPVEKEQSLAADMELSAQRLGVFLDGGESLLCAILIERILPLLATGDKRAIVALERLVDTDHRLQVLCGKVTCMEQLFAAAIKLSGCANLRAAVCSEPGIDKALTICFSCLNQSVEDSTVTKGLQSYINDLRRNAGRVLSS